MKFLGLFLISAIFSSSVFAATFTPIAKVSSDASNKLASVAATITKNEAVFGDSSSLKVFSFVRKETEQNANTIKQLSYMKGGATSDDSQFDLEDQTIAQLVTYSFMAVEGQEHEHEAEFKKAKTGLTAAFKAIKADKTLKLFGSAHADEDGSWQIVYVLDTANNQILMMTVGFSGT